ncbi:hypothetical protein SAMN04488057_106197 [Cyclobacterium lianum]|uniref:Uncharacterized protein n=1 Tax=Cyclobacterium lianum TaxID=388280 RepID=A0A1M7NZI0_9BACT|nr:hypothetical protein SAMN04488057_106197 [Cyclobacterium lianum]
MYKHFLILILIVFQHSIAWGQSQQVYDGDYEFKGRQGQATFEFSEDNDGKLILDGFFRFRLTEIDSLDQTLLKKFQVSGEYQQNKKEGNWRFDSEIHRISLDDVIDFEVIASLESEDIEVNATYRNGIREGNWRFDERTFVQGELAPKATANSIKFSDGYIVDDIYFRRFEGDFTQFIRGEINDRGFMDGEWSLVYLKDSLLISEVRNYENGFLLGLTKRNLKSNERIEEAIFYSTIEKLNQANEGENEGFEIAERKFGLVFNDGYRPSSPHLKIQVDGNEFIDEFISKLLQFDEAVDEDGKILTYPFFTKRFEFEYESETEESLREIPKIYSELEELVTRTSEMNSLSLNKDKSDSLSFAYRYFQDRKLKIEQMAYFLDLIESGDIKYFDLNNFTGRGIEFMSPIDLITYEYQGDTLRRMIPRVVSVEGNEAFFKSFENYLREELSIASRLGSYVDDQLYSIEVDNTLMALEAKILEEKTRVDSLYLGQETGSEEEQEMFEAIFANFLKESFADFSEQYAEAEDFAIKTEKGELMLDLLNELTIRLPELSAIYPANEEIDELYKEETFNPFTYTRYDVRAKERLYESGAVKLFEHYLEALKDESDYTQIKDHISKIQKLQERMIQLRDADTKGLERRLGRRSSINRIESALDL